MSEATEKLIDTNKDSENPVPSDAPILGPDPLPSVIVISETDRARPWSGHGKYLRLPPFLAWLLNGRLYIMYLRISFFYTLFAAMLSASVGYISYVLSDGNEWVRYGMWTLLLLKGNHGIFRLIRPKKSKGPPDPSDRVRVLHAKVIIFSLYIFISGTLAQVLTNLGLGFFDLDQVPFTHDICANQVNPLGHRRCCLWRGAWLLQFAAPWTAFAASAVLRHAAIKRFGKEKVPMDSPPQVEAWQMAILEQLNEDTEPIQV